MTMQIGKSTTGIFITKNKICITKNYSKNRNNMNKINNFDDLCIYIIKKFSTTNYFILKIFLLLYSYSKFQEFMKI